MKDSVKKLMTDLKNAECRHGLGGAVCNAKLISYGCFPRGDDTCFPCRAKALTERKPNSKRGSDADR